MAEKIDKLSCMKGLCILLMVIGHSGCPRLLTNFIYLFHMPCFFIISGYLFNPRYLESPATFIKKKIIGLYVPYVFYGVIYLFLHDFLYKFHFYSSPNTSSYINNLFSLLTFRGVDQLLGGYWFLQSLFVAFVFSFILMKVLSYSHIHLSFCSGISVLVFLFGSFGVSLYQRHIPLFDSCNLLAASYVSLGVFVKSLDFRTRNKPLYALILVLSIILIFVAYFYKETPNMAFISGFELLVFYFISIVGTILIYLIIDCMPRYVNNHLLYLGSITLYILTFHMFGFKLASLVKILLYKLPLSKLESFPAIVDNNEFFWMVYVFFGISFSVMMAKVINILKQRFIAAGND